MMDGEEETVTYTTLIIYIKVNSLTYEKGASAYGFTSEQIEIADEMMSPDYYTLYAELLGVDFLGDADLTEIIFNLPVGTEGAEGLKAALTKLGAPYVMGAKGPYKFDCSGLAYWAINEDDPELGSISTPTLQDRQNGVIPMEKLWDGASFSRAIWYFGRTLAVRAAAGGTKSITSAYISGTARLLKRAAAEAVLSCGIYEKAQAILFTLLRGRTKTEQTAYAYYYMTFNQSLLRFFIL